MMVTFIVVPDYTLSLKYRFRKEKFSGGEGGEGKSVSRRTTKVERDSLRRECFFLDHGYE